MKTIEVIGVVSVVAIVSVVCVVAIIYRCQIAVGVKDKDIFMNITQNDEEEKKTEEPYESAGCRGVLIDD